MRLYIEFKDVHNNSEFAVEKHIHQIIIERSQTYPPNLINPFRRQRSSSVIGIHNHKSSCSMSLFIHEFLHFCMNK